MCVTLWQSSGKLHLFQTSEKNQLTRRGALCTAEPWCSCCSGAGAGREWGKISIPFIFIFSPVFPWNYCAGRIRSWLVNVLQHMHLGYNLCWVWWLCALCLGINYFILQKFPFYFLMQAISLVPSLGFWGFERSWNAVSGQFILIWTKNDFQL